VITRALGTDPEVDVDTYTIESQPGDVFLLCSDGLTSMVGDAAILEAIAEHGRDLDSAARELVVRANRGGGEDNITVVFFEIAEDGAAAPKQTAVLPAADEPEPEREPDEDTLDELDRVPAVQTQVFKTQDLEAAVAAAPAKKPRSRMDRLAARVLATVVVLVVLAAIVLLAVWGLLD